MLMDLFESISVAGRRVPSTLLTYIIAHAIWRQNTGAAANRAA
jgi:hypothetical protein